MAGQDGGKIIADAAGPSVAKAVGDIGTALADHASKDTVKYVGLAKTAKENNDLAAAADYEAKAKAASERPTSKEWGELENGTNQGVKHFADYWEQYPERIPSIESRLGLEPGTFGKSAEGFDSFTNAAKSVIEKGQERILENGKIIYYLDGAVNAKKGVVVITKNGKLQTMMASDPKSFAKMK